MRARQDTDRLITLGSAATCAVCEREIPRGTRVRYRGRDVAYRHPECEERQGDANEGFA